MVTGAFGYTGRYITRRLLGMGHRVRTLTGHPERPNPFGDRVTVAPLDFDDTGRLARSLEGAESLFNTNWIRFPRGALTFERAVNNTRALIEAAEVAGVRRIVQVSVMGASPDSPLPYFRGKGLIEEAVRSSHMSYAIIRPAVTFGNEDVLINNIAWFLRRFPVFALFGSGEYRIQPVFVEDMAEIAVNASERADNLTTDAAGPETFTFQEMVRLIADTVSSRARLVHVGPRLGHLAAMLLGYLVRDVVITRDEIEGLCAGLLVSNGEPTGHTSLSEWLAQNAGTVGSVYASELRRHYR